MNTQFVDIAVTVSNLVQSGASKADGKSSFPERGQGFEDRYQQEISRVESNRSSRTDVSIPVKSGGQRVAAAVSDTAESMKDTEGVAFLSKLEQVLRQISGGDLKGLFMDANGLDALKKLLLKAGFDPEEVEGLISDLKEKAIATPLGLDEVFDALSELVVEVDEKASTEAVYLETSALPFIKTLMSELGLTDEEIAGIVEEAEQGGEGISLNVVIEKLKTLEAGLRENGQTLAVADTEGSFKRLMSQLNLPAGDGAKDVVSLNDMIRAFEAYKELKQGQAEAGTEKSASALAAMKTAADSEPAAALLNTLFQSFSMAPESKGLGFSYQQIKDQFVNEMMLPAKGKAGQKGLFAQQVLGADEKTDTLVKEMVALVSKGPGSNDASSSGRERSAAVFGKELKIELTKAEAVFQGSAGTGSDIDASRTLSKAKAAPRTLPAYVTHQVGRGIVRAVNQGESSLTLQLKPPELGRLSMTIDHHSTGIKVSIVTENQSARDMLASNINELKSALSSAGISLESFDVDMNSDFRQSMANAGNQTGGRKNGNKQGSGLNAQETGDEMAAAAEDLVTDGSYHFVA
jgi:flagellar hook-length control protein FliK